MYLLDTNVISEVRRKDGDPAVRTWFDGVDGADLFLSVLVVGEITRGIAVVKDRDPAFATSLQTWLDGLVQRFADRLLPVDTETALAWGRLTAARTVPAIDGLLAATARRHDMTLVTRNVADLAGLDVALLNPFEAS